MRIGIPIGIAAGLVSALVLMAAATGSVVALFLLFLLAPLPIVIAGLGWGWPSGMIAALTAAGTLLAIINAKTALFHWFAIGLPMAALCYLLLLNRNLPPMAPGEQPRTEWYPVGRVVAATALLAGGLATVALLATATDMDSLQAVLRRTIDQMAAGRLPFPKDSIDARSDVDLDAIAKLMTQSFAALIATYWVAMASFNLWLGGLITHASGRLARPWPDLSELTLPRQTPLAFVGAIALSFLSGYPGLIASGFASAIFFAYLLVGLAIIHNRTRGIDLRPLILFAVYMSLVVLNPFSGIIIAMVGISEPISPFRRHGTGPPAPDD